MAKARPLRKDPAKAGAKSSSKRAGGAARTAKPSSRTPVVADKRTSGGERKPSIASQKVIERPAVVPETPPPLPAPIASFTF